MTKRLYEARHRNRPGVIRANGTRFSYEQKGERMSHTWQELRSLSDEELVAVHDEKAATTGVGIQYYLDELRYRSQTRIVEKQSRIAARVEKFTRYILWLTVAITMAILINISMMVLETIMESGVAW